MKKRIEIVQFYDHCLGGPDVALLTCEAVGMLVYEDKKVIKLASWVAEGQVDNPNNEVFCIMKSCITKRKRVK